MSLELTAFERDELWLTAHGHGDIDAEKFSDWVTRCISDGLPETRAREYVLKQLLKKQTAGSGR